MKITARPLSLLIALALGSFALDAVTTSSAGPAAPIVMQTVPFSGVDASVPPASTVTFPVDEEAAAPTF